MFTNDFTSTERKEIHTLLHTLWTKDVGTEGYDKDKWIRMSLLLDKSLGPVSFDSNLSISKN